MSLSRGTPVSLTMAWLASVMWPSELMATKESRLVSIMDLAAGFCCVRCTDLFHRVLHGLYGSIADGWGALCRGRTDPADGPCYRGIGDGTSACRSPLTDRRSRRDDPVSYTHLRA